MQVFWKIRFFLKFLGKKEGETEQKYYSFTSIVCKFQWVLLVVELCIEARDLDVLDTVVSNLNQRSCILGTKLNSIKPLAFCKPGALSTELRIQFISSSRKKQTKKTSVLSEKIHQEKEIYLV